MLIWSLIYLFITILTSIDDSDKEAYISTYPDIEISIQQAVQQKIDDPTLIIETDHRGWFQLAHKSNDIFFLGYDIVFSLYIVSIVCGLYWIILCLVDIIRYKNNTRIKTSCVILA